MTRIAICSASITQCELAHVIVGGIACLRKMTESIERGITVGIRYVAWPGRIA